MSPSVFWRFEIVFAQLGLVVLSNCLELGLLGFYVVVILNYTFDVVFCLVLNSEDVIVGQVFRVFEVLVIRLDHHFLFQVCFRFVHLLAFLYEFRLIFIFWQAAIAISGIHVVNRLYFFLVVRD